MFTKFSDFKVNAFSRYIYRYILQIIPNNLIYKSYLFASYYLNIRHFSIIYNIRDFQNNMASLLSSHLIGLTSHVIKCDVVGYMAP